MAVDSTLIAARGAEQIALLPSGGSELAERAAVDSGVTVEECSGVVRAPGGSHPSSEMSAAGAFMVR